MIEEDNVRSYPRQKFLQVPSTPVNVTNPKKAQQLTEKQVTQKPSAVIKPSIIQAEHSAPVNIKPVPKELLEPKQPTQDPIPPKVTPKKHTRQTQTTRQPTKQVLEVSYPQSFTEYSPQRQAVGTSLLFHRKQKLISRYLLLIIPVMMFGGLISLATPNWWKVMCLLLGPAIILPILLTRLLQQRTVLVDWALQKIQFGRKPIQDVSEVNWIALKEQKSLGETKKLTIEIGVDGITYSTMHCSAPFHTITVKEIQALQKLVEISSLPQSAEDEDITEYILNDFTPTRTRTAAELGTLKAKMQETKKTYGSYKESAQHVLQNILDMNPNFLRSK